MDRNGEPTNAAQERSLDGLRRRYPTEPSVDEALTRRMRKRERTGARYSSPSLETVEARLARRRHAFGGRKWLRSRHRPKGRGMPREKKLICLLQ
jgi:hypothetical protein